MNLIEFVSLFYRVRCSKKVDLFIHTTGSASSTGLLNRGTGHLGLDHREEFVGTYFETDRNS